MSFELVSEIDTIETATASDGVGQVAREFKQVDLFRFITSYEMPSEVNTTKGVLTFLYNGALQIKSLSNPKKFLCTVDGVVREEVPGAGAKRVQTWIHYGDWAATTAFSGA